MAKETPVTVQEYVDVRDVVAEAATDGARIGRNTGLDIAETLMIRGFVDIDAVLAHLRPHGTEPSELAERISRTIEQVGVAD